MPPSGGGGDRLTVSPGAAADKPPPGVRGSCEARSKKSQFAWIRPQALLRPVGADPRFSPSEPAGLRVCRLSVFLWEPPREATPPSSPATRSGAAPTVVSLAVRVLTMLVPAALLVALGWADGGYHPRGWGALLVAAGVLLAAGGLLVGDVELDRRRAVFVGGLLALATWSLVSRAWALAPDGAVLEAERTLAYAGLAGAAVLTVPRRRLDDLLVGVLAGAGVVSAGGLVRHALGAAAAERLELPIGYANASGIVACVGILLGLGLCIEGPAARRALGAAVCPPAAVVLLLSLSRGAVVAGALGAVLLLVTSRASGSWRRAAAVVLASAVAAVLVEWAEPFTVPGGSAGEVAWLVVVAALAAAAAAAAVVQPGAGAARLRGRWAGTVAASATVAAVIALGVAGVAAVRDDRSTPAALQGASARLLSSSTSYRSDYWEVAGGAVRDRPLLGLGAGGFERRWLRERDELLFVRDAHNLYLETLAELGPFGLAVLLSVLVVPLTGTRAVVASAPGRAVLAAYAALLAHAALDWDWELPVVTLCTLLLAVVLLGLGRETAPTEPSGLVRGLLVAAAAGLVALGVDVRRAADATPRANEALDRGDAVRAADGARDARRLTPWAAEPWRLLGEAEVAAGRLAAGRAHLRRATREDPDAAGTWLALAFATEGAESRAALGRVRALDPLAPELAVLGADDPSKG